MLMLSIALVEFCSYQMNKQKKKVANGVNVLFADIRMIQAKLWSLILIYHFENGYQLTPSGRLSNQNPICIADNLDNFKCSYIQLGGLFPISHEYSSQTGMWNFFDSFTKLPHNE